IEQMSLLTRTWFAINTIRLRQPTPSNRDRARIDHRERGTTLSVSNPSMIVQDIGSPCVGSTLSRPCRFDPKCDTCLVLTPSSHDTATALEFSGHGCPVCGGTDLRLYLDAENPDMTHEGIGSSRKVFSPGRVLRCAKCRHGFRKSPPTPAELSELYRRMDVEVYEAEHESRVQTAKRHVRLLSRWASPGRLLDVGCASGVFLEQALRFGWDVAGVEPNEALVSKAARRVGSQRLWNTTLEEADFAPESFDAITLWDVVEHVVDPPDFLRRCARLVKPSGTILFKIPNLDSWQARVMGRRWPLLLPEHLGYFTRSSIRASAERAGLEVVFFGRGAVTFTAGYILLRAGQHRVPLTQFGYRVAGNGFLGRLRLSIRLGELYVVARRASTNHQPAGDLS